MSTHTAHSTHKAITGPLSRTGRAIWLDTVLLTEVNKWDESNAERNAQGRAAYIVRACNALPALVSAIEKMLQYRDSVSAWGFQLEKLDDYLEQARAALAQAEGNR